MLWGPSANTSSSVTVHVHSMSPVSSTEGGVQSKVSSESIVTSTFSIPLALPAAGRKSLTVPESVGVVLFVPCVVRVNVSGSVLSIINVCSVLTVSFPELSSAVATTE